MRKPTYAGQIPEYLDTRLERRDADPLPPNAFVKFQFINRGPSPRYNYRWLLHQDGRLFVALHSGDVSDIQIPFDTDFPAQPSMKLNARQMKKVKRVLLESGFFEQPPYQADDSVEDGSFYVLAAKIDDQEHEVIYEAVYPPLIDFLANLVSIE